MSNTIFIIAHAPLANALRDCAMHVYPECAHEVIALDVLPDAQPEETLRLANLALQNAPQEGLLVLTDIFGATPANVAQKVVGARRAKLIAVLTCPCFFGLLAIAMSPWTTWWRGPWPVAPKA